MYKSRAEKLSDIDKKMEHLKAQKRVLQNLEKKRERTRRTNRLSRIGGMVEKYAGCEIEDFDALETYLKQYGYAIGKTQSKKIADTPSYAPASESDQSSNLFSNVYNDYN